MSLIRITSLILSLILRLLILSPQSYSNSSGGGGTLTTVVTALSISSSRPNNKPPLNKSSRRRSILVTGANKGQGYALCKRILTEYDDTHVFLCSRDVTRGREAMERLLLLPSSIDPNRIDVIQMDVTDSRSIHEAYEQVKTRLNGDKLYGLVSNAGILWGYSLSELIDVCTVGVKNVLDEFVPSLLLDDDGRVIVVSSGLGPLMHGYASAEHQEVLKAGAAGSSWESISSLIRKCLDVDNNTPEEFERIGFPGGPFAESAPDFHMYGLSKMFADAYMLTLAKSYPNIQINSCDPGLVYTDLIGKMPKYAGKTFEETGAQTPEQGCEAAMRLLFRDEKSSTSSSMNGMFYAMTKDKAKLVCSEIDKMPNK